MRVYLAGPMRGIPEFNFPAFYSAAAFLRETMGWEVFSPAEKDNEVHGKDFIKQFKTAEEANIPNAESQGFSLRRALGDDTAWICAYGDGVVMLPGWEKSRGAVAENALAKALNQKVFILEQEQDIWIISEKAY
jgi:Domain of unknown function (DUF4406)